MSYWIPAKQKAQINIGCCAISIEDQIIFAQIVLQKDGILIATNFLDADNIWSIYMPSQQLKSYYLHCNKCKKVLIDENAFKILIGIFWLSGSTGAANYLESINIKNKKVQL